jgi:hypothetical protein
MRLKKILDTSRYLPKTLYHNSNNKSDSVKGRCDKHGELFTIFFEQQS